MGFRALVQRLERDFAQFFILFCAILRAPSSRKESPPNSIKRTKRSRDSSNSQKETQKGSCPKKGKPEKPTRANPEKVQRLIMAPEEKFKMWPKFHCQSVKLPIFWTTAVPWTLILIRSTTFWECQDKSGKAGQPVYQLAFTAKLENKPMNSQGLGFDIRWTIILDV